MEGFNHRRICSYKNKGSGVSYQKDFLGIFTLTEWNGSHISDVVDKLVAKFEHEAWFSEILKKSPFFDPDDKSISLSGMFNFDQMDTVHVLLSRAVRGESMTGKEVDSMVESLELRK